MLIYFRLFGNWGGLSVQILYSKAKSGTYILPNVFHELQIKSPKQIQTYSNNNIEALQLKFINHSQSYSNEFQWLMCCNRNVSILFEYVSICFGYFICN